MEFGKTDDSYIVRLARGEKISESINRLCQYEDIQNAHLSGIGSIEKVVLAHYRVDTKKYSEKKLDGVFEVSLMGNVGNYNGKPISHIHAVISDSQMQSFAGHFVESVVSATMEIVIVKLPSDYQKKDDREIGLKLWRLPEKT